MPSHRIPFIALIILLLVVSSAPAAPSQESLLQSARTKFRAKEYASAVAAARDAAPGGERDFMLGLASYRLEQWETAATALGQAASGYPLLSDYARYYQAKALEQLNRPAQMVAPLTQLLTGTPESPLARQALLLLANAQFQQESWAEAHVTFQRYIAKYPAGADALAATYRSALCKERLGETPAAIQSLYLLWLTSPASPYADKAEAEMKSLRSAGHQVPVPSPEDLYKRGATLYDLKRYDAAIKALQSVPAVAAENPDFSAKVLFKTGQSLFRAKRYREAELTFSGLLASAKAQAAEVWYWLGRALDRAERDREAVATYRKLVEQFASSELADDALYQAALLEEDLGNWPEAARLLSRLLTDYRGSELRLSAQWAYAWGLYRNGDFGAAIPEFRKLLESDPFRDRGLYWLAKAYGKSGDNEGARATAATMLTEFPHGFYANFWRREHNIADPPLPSAPIDLARHLPWPAGFEREKALIALGMAEEARTELARHRNKPHKGSAAAGLARLHLEIDDFSGAYHLLKKRHRTVGKDPVTAWALSYPMAYREEVLKQSGKNGLPPELVYGVMRTESTFSPTVVSPAGAVGLMQIMPSTAARMVNGNGNGAEALKQPEHNIRLGTRHLKDLLALYKGDQVFALAAYNAGGHNVDRWRKSIGSVPVDEFIERIPFAETRDYVKKVLSAASVYRRLYPSQAPPPSPPVFADYSSLNED